MQKKGKYYHFYSIARFRGFVKPFFYGGVFFGIIDPRKSHRAFSGSGSIGKVRYSFSQGLPSTNRTVPWVRSAIKA